MNVDVVCEDISETLCWIEDDIEVDYIPKNIHTKNGKMLKLCQKYTHTCTTFATTDTYTSIGALHSIRSNRNERKKWKICMYLIHLVSHIYSCNIHKHLHIITHWSDCAAECLSFSHVATLTLSCSYSAFVTNCDSYFTRKTPKNDPSKCDKYANAEKKKSCIRFIRNFILFFTRCIRLHYFGFMWQTYFNWLCVRLFIFDRSTS